MFWEVNKNMTQPTGDVGEPRIAISEPGKVDLSDILVSLIVMSKIDRFTSNPQALSYALKQFLDINVSSLPKLKFQLVQNSVYYDDIDKTLNLLMLSGMLRLENPEYRYFRVSPLIKKKFNISIKHKFSVEQLDELKNIATNISDFLK